MLWTGISNFHHITTWNQLARCDVGARRCMRQQCCVRSSELVSSRSRNLSRCLTSTWPQYQYVKPSNTSQQTVPNLPVPAPHSRSCPLPVGSSAPSACHISPCFLPLPKCLPKRTETQERCYGFRVTVRYRYPPINPPINLLRWPRHELHGIEG